MKETHISTSTNSAEAKLYWPKGKANFTNSIVAANHVYVTAEQNTSPELCHCWQGDVITDFSNAEGDKILLSDAVFNFASGDGSKSGVALTDNVNIFDTGINYHPFQSRDVCV